MQHSSTVPASHRSSRDTTIRRSAFAQGISSSDQRRLLKGRIVRFEDGAPIPGANVELDGFQTTADSDGSFCLPLGSSGPTTPFRAAAPGYFACIETLNLACIGSGGMLSRVFRLVPDGSASAETHRLELSLAALLGPGQDTEALLSIGELQPLGSLLDRLLAGPSSTPPHPSAHSGGVERSGVERSGVERSGVERFELALEHGITSLFDARPEDADPWMFDEDDDDLLIFDDDEDDNDNDEGDGLDDEERILFGDDSDDWSSDEVEYSVDWD